MTRVNSSVLWDFFRKLHTEDKKAKCIICHDTYSYKSSTGNLKSHLKKKHRDAYRRVVITQQQNVAAAGHVTFQHRPKLVTNEGKNLGITNRI